MADFQCSESYNEIVSVEVMQRNYNAQLEA